MSITSKDIAKMIDHSILQPTYTDADLKAQVAVAVKYNVATVCVKPYHTALARELVKGTTVGICPVIGFPAGNSPVASKVFEADYVCKEGATEVDMVVNIGKVLGGDWDYVDAEIKAVNDAVVKHGAILKVIFETDYVTNDADKIKLCEICTKHNVGFVKTSTGYGFVKGADGKFSYTGATEHDLKLMRKHSGPKVQVKASGGVRTLDQILAVREWGATRVGATATEQIVEDAKKKFGA